MTYKKKRNVWDVGLYYLCVCLRDHCSSTDRVHAEYRPLQNTYCQIILTTHIYSFGEKQPQTVSNESLYMFTTLLKQHNFCDFDVFVCSTEDNNTQETLRREVDCLFV